MAARRTDAGPGDGGDGAPRRPEKLPKSLEEAPKYDKARKEKYPYEDWQAKGDLEAGRCFKELKDNDKAREMLGTVIKKFPKRSEAKSAAQVLATLPKPKPKPKSKSKSK